MELKKHSNFKLPSWAQNIGGGLVGSSAGLGFESLGFLVGIPAAGTGLWTYIGACKGDKRCESTVTNWFNKNKPSTHSSSSPSSKPSAYSTSPSSQEASQGLVQTNIKPILIIGGSILAVITIVFISYKLTK